MEEKMDGMPLLEPCLGPSRVHAVGEVELAEMLSVSVRRIRQMVSTGQLPPPLRYRRVYWWSSTDIEVWMTEQVEGREMQTQQNGADDE